MNTFVQLLQAALVILATGAGLFAGQFSRMKTKRFNDASKLMLAISGLLVIASDLFNLLPSNNIMLWLYGGGASGYFLVYAACGLLVYTGFAYAFSYHMLTKERLKKAYNWADGVVEGWRHNQAEVTGHHSLASDDETHDNQ